MTVIVYSKPHCLECNVLKRFLDDYKISYEERDCSGNSAYMDEIKQMGFSDVPVTVVYNTAVQGLQPDEILAVIYKQEKEGNKSANLD